MAVWASTSTNPAALWPVKTSLNDWIFLGFSCEGILAENNSIALRGRCFLSLPALQADRQSLMQLIGCDTNATIGKLCRPRWVKRGTMSSVMCCGNNSSHMILWFMMWLNAVLMACIANTYIHLPSGRNRTSAPFIMIWKSHKSTFASTIIVEFNRQGIRVLCQNTYNLPYCRLMRTWLNLRN